MREHQRIASMGRALLALHNIHVTRKWWKGKAWTAIKAQDPVWVIERLEVFIVILKPLEEQEVKLMHQLREAAREKKISLRVGPLTFEILRRKVKLGLPGSICMYKIQRCIRLALAVLSPVNQPN